MPSQLFDTVADAIRSLEDASVDQSFTLTISGPRDLAKQEAVYVQVVRCPKGFLVHLAFDPAARKSKELGAFVASRHFRDFTRVEWHWVPSFEKSFGWDAEAAARCVADVLRTIKKYTPETPLTVEVVNDDMRWKVGQMREPTKAGR
jgi:hypothetical protein